MKCKVASLSFVGNSVLGKSARIGSGVITANRRFDQQHICFKNGSGQKIDSKTGFLGSVIGDNTRIGAGVILSPRNTC